MKVVLFANHQAALPVIEYFYVQGWLKAVVSTDKPNSYNQDVADACKSNGIPLIPVNKQQLSAWLPQYLNGIKPDAVFMIGFSYRIPASVFNIPKLGFYNVHYSLLPAYRGSDPIFWQLKIGETAGGITIHRVDEEFDTGEIVMQQAIPFIKGENWGICTSRYTPVALSMVKKLSEVLANGEAIQQVKTDALFSYYPKPQPEDFAIQWDVHSADEVENLVNACNPSIKGALTLLNRQLVKVLEVSPIDAVGELLTPGGTIVHADGSGLFIQCADRKILRINILKLNEGFLTGFKAAALGLKKGDRFESVDINQLAIN